MINFSISKSYKESLGFQLNIDGNIENGQFVCIYGPSGAGKTSFLRCLSGLEKIDSGHIKLEDSVWCDTLKRVNLPPNKRKIGFVFQDYALFPNMTVSQNLNFALPHRIENNPIPQLIDLFELESLKDRLPRTLSGGEKQRLAIARSLVQQPDLLLLDEPLAALDPNLTSKIQNYLLAIQKKWNLTVIMVSHDLAEIIKLADEVWILSQGKISQKGKPLDLFSRDLISGRFQVKGQIIQIEKRDIIYVVSILIDKTIIKVVVSSESIHDHKVGDHVLVTSKAFNPVLIKI